MEKFLTIKGVDWLYEYGPSPDYLDELMGTYDLHELIEEDLLESNTQDKIDVYDQCLFAVLHFPKYRIDSDKYIQNEFNIVLWKDYIITLARYKSNHIQAIKEQYETSLETVEKDEQYKFSPYYILYRLIDEMYDKVIRGIRHFSRDVAQLEEDIFEWKSLDKKTLEAIMKKKRNIVMLKHTIAPHQEIIDELQEETMKFYGGELDVYFEDLTYKIDKILGQIAVQAESMDSLYDTYNALVSMKTNSIVTVLTVFTVILWVMTMVTGFFGMNVSLPLASSQAAFALIVGVLLFAGLWMLLFFRYKKWL